MAGYRIPTLISCDSSSRSDNVRQSVLLYSSSILQVSFKYAACKDAKIAQVGFKYTFSRLQAFFEVRRGSVMQE
jgi:hypothetical protein